MSPAFAVNDVIWLLVAVISLLLCTYLPIKIKNDRRRRLAYWVILVPVSLVLISYVYPAGIDFFSRMGSHF